jgi:hypothetical protein
VLDAASVSMQGTGRRTYPLFYEKKEINQLGGTVTATCIKQSTEYLTEFASGVGTGQFVTFSRLLVHKTKGGPFISSTGGAHRQGSHINIHYKPLTWWVSPGKSLLLKKVLKHLLQLEQVLWGNPMKDFANLGLISELSLAPGCRCQFVRNKAVVNRFYIWATGNHRNKEFHDFFNWCMVNGLHIDLEMSVKQVNEPDLLSIVPSGKKQSCDGEVIEIGQSIEFDNAVHWHTSFEESLDSASVQQEIGDS